MRTAVEVLIGRPARRRAEERDPFHHATFSLGRASPSYGMATLLPSVMRALVDGQDRQRLPDQTIDTTLSNALKVARSSLDARLIGIVVPGLGPESPAADPPRVVEARLAPRRRRRPA